MPIDAEELRGSALSKDILARYRSAVRAARDRESTLRFGRHTVAVSSIAQQFYCEKALQYSIEKPLAPTLQMRNGTAGHEMAAALAAPMTHEEAIAEALVSREKPVCIYEFRIAWEHNGVTLTGFVDEAWFRGGNVDIVAERKFSGSPNIYSTYHIQAGLYCLGLGEMGFDTNRTIYRIDVFSRKCSNCERLASGECSILREDCHSYACDTGSSISQSFPFHRESVTEDLDWALQFWTGERDAEPTTSATRCRSCRYRRICDSSLA
ncbi:MAG: hypothetical protein JW846_08700 [Dehalococcoidia bacterium]|nr:hypothetical protein [Dehalococcoidia bacterium]